MATPCRDAMHEFGIIHIQQPAHWIRSILKFGHSHVQRRCGSSLGRLSFKREQGTSPSMIGLLREIGTRRAARVHA